MLEIRKQITILGESKVDGKTAEKYSATIDDADPKTMSISRWKANEDLYKENREQCRKDYAEFEDTAYLLQEEMKKQ